MKFKRLNVMQYARENGLSYCVVDLLRQSSIEQLVKAFNGVKSVDWTKTFILKQVSVLLSKMIIEEKSRR